MPKPADGDGHEPDQHDWTEECRHLGGAVRLEREQQHQDERGQRHHVVIERRSGDLEALDGGQH